MNQNQAAAFVAAQTALLNCRVEAMKSENDLARMRGDTIPYAERAFTATEECFEPVIGYNAVMQLYQNCEP